MLKPSPSKKQINEAKALDSIHQRNLLHQYAAKAAMVRMKDESGSDFYWMVLMQNNLVLYKSKEEPQPDQYHTKVYNLLTNVEGLGPNPKGDPGIAFMAVKKEKPGKEPKRKQVVITMASHTVQAEWLERLNRQITSLRPLWQQLQDAGGEKIIEEMLAALPRSEKADKADYLEKFEGFFKFMQTRFNSFRKYSPLAHSMKNFSEYFNEASREYLKWVMGISDGVDPSCERYLLKIEENQLNVWREKVKKIYAAYLDAFDTRFFQEDFKEVLKQGEEAYAWVDCLTKYNKTIHPDNPLEFQPELTVMRTYAELFNKLPNSKDLTLATLGDGSGEVLPMPFLRETSPRWTWDRDPESKGAAQWKMECKTHKNLPFWVCSNGYEIRSSWYGSVLWNKVSWVWFHPRIRFSIRYNWRIRDATFVFHPSKGEIKKGEVLLPDWKWDRATNILAPIKRNNGEKTKDIQPFKVSGRVPLILVLIIAMTAHIQATVGEQLGFEVAQAEVKNDDPCPVYYTPGLFRK